ncbi:hypothetical protein [Natronomonas sp. EA1]|uniref:hypothetical protein n=1 Tax=Natronomonas sp. EA1 TaxID=3421655 RepID=UPI003EC15400
MAATLSEPQVLAHTKRRLFPDTEGYAVCDTQFARETWLEGVPVDPAIQEVLAPFNHVRVGSGYPDLVGVRALDSDLLAVERFGDDPPLVAVEAKGYAQGGVDVERAVVQAYDRLGEANAVYAAVPASAVTQGTRTLARELNVGLLAVDPGGTVDPLERPRVVGNRTSTEGQAIRVQASAQGVTEQSFSLNHPKNYLGYPLACYAEGETDALVAEHVVGAVAGARTGAVMLGLVEDGAGRERLTGLGAEVVRFALAEYGDVDAALGAFDDWHGSPARFTSLAPRWAQLARRVVYEHPAVALIAHELQRFHDDHGRGASLPELVTYLYHQHPTFAVELFLRRDADVRSRAFDAEDSLRPEVLQEGSVYHSPTVFQLKAILYHVGLVTSRGSEPSTLTPSEDSWALADPLRRFRPC